MLKDRITTEVVNKGREQLDQLLERIKESHEKYAIWGAANSGKLVISYIDSYSYNTLRQSCIVDNNPAVWNGNSIIGAERFLQIMDQISVVLICVYVADQVERQLRQMGYKGDIFIVSASSLCLEDTYKFYEKNMEHLEWIYSISDDEKSRDTMVAFINYIRTGDVSVWNPVNGNSVEKLMDTEVLSFTDEENLVDVGAFIGDTVEQFLKDVNGNYKSIIAIEPDTGNYRQLEKKFAEWNLHDVTTLNVAVGSYNGKSGFNKELSESCFVCIDGESGDEIRMVSLDCLEECADATFIKISTNGYEYEVVKGAEELIKKKRPKLAFYASGKELWEIPEYLRSIVPEYKIFVRHYGIGSQAMIIYAYV